MTLLLEVAYFYLVLQSLTINKVELNIPTDVILSQQLRASVVVFVVKAGKHMMGL